MDLALGQRERAVGCERINVLMNERARGHGFSYVRGCESQRVTPERAGGGTHELSDSWVTDWAGTALVLSYKPWGVYSWRLVCWGWWFGGDCRYHRDSHSGERVEDDAWAVGWGPGGVGGTLLTTAN